MKKIIFLLFALLIPAANVSAGKIDSVSYNVEYPFILDSITITGNDITEEEIILRELTFSPGDTLTAEMVKYNKERVFSLGIFTKVEIYPRKVNSNVSINIHVEESWYIYPVPFVQLKNKDWNKLSYGFYVVVKNFRGRNETLSGRASFGYDPSFSVSYYKPSITRGSNIFFEIEASYLTTANISSIAERLYGKEFEQKAILSQVLVGKRYGLFNWLSINLNYNYLETPFYIKGVSASNSRIDRFPQIGLNYSYDTRDLIQFPKDGIFFGTNIQWKGWGINDVNYATYSIDFREYRNLFADLYGKWRLASRLSIGYLIPYYDYSYLGYIDRVRGHFSRQFEGHHSYISAAELFYPIIKDMNLDFEWVPIVPNQLLRYRAAIYAQLFIDTGAVQNRGRAFGIKNFSTGYGAGLTFLVLPYNSLRIEFAWDEFSNNELIIDLGISF